MVDNNALVRGKAANCSRLARARVSLAVIIGFAVLSVLLLNSCGYDRVNYKVSALIYTDNEQEEEFLRKYNEIFSNANLELEFFNDTIKYFEKVQFLFNTDQLPDIFSVWYNSQYAPILNSDKLVDLRYAAWLNAYDINSFNLGDKYEPVKIFPLRYDYDNVMLVNMDLLESINNTLVENVRNLNSYEDFLNLAQIVKDHGIDFLVVDDASPSSLGDLFFSVVIGGINRYGIRRLAKGREKYWQSTSMSDALLGFYSRFRELFPDPSLAKLSEDNAEGMFLDGQVLLIIGSNQNLLSLMRNSKFNVDWLAFPQVVRQRQDAERSQNYFGFLSEDWALMENQENITQQRKKGALLGDFGGIALSEKVNSYNPMHYNEVTSVFQYFTGDYANALRIQEWGIPGPASHVVVVDDEEDKVMSETINFLQSINYVYYRPSMYLSKDFNQLLNEETWKLLQGHKTPEIFVEGLLKQLSRSEEFTGADSPKDDVADVNMQDLDSEAPAGEQDNE